MSAVFRAACIQMCSGLSPEANVADALTRVDEAVRQGAQFVATPEMTNIIDPKRDRLAGKVATMDDDAGVAAFAAGARHHGIHLLAGSFALRRDGGGLVNRSILFGPDGTVLAVYDKMHMFDVALPNGERYRESSSYTPGARAVIARTRLGCIGLSVCYDLRFAALYRTLAQAGAEIVTIPSAFTRPTGQAHWEVLLRARAIETGAFILAPAQTGEHQSGRKTWGHSMIVAPWGDVIAQAGDAPGIIIADIDMSRVSEARQRIPALQHDRAFGAPGSENVVS